MGEEINFGPPTYENIMKQHPAKTELLGEEYVLNLRKSFLPSRKSFTVTNDFTKPVSIVDVGQILKGSASMPGDKIQALESETSAERPTVQNRYGLIRDVINKKYDFDPRTPDKHDLEKIGSYNADRYLVEFYFRGEPITLIVTNWYAHAVYLTKSSNYDCSYNRKELLDHGAKRFNWRDETITFDSLYLKMQKILHELVPLTK